MNRNTSICNAPATRDRTFNPPSVSHIRSTAPAVPRHTITPTPLDLARKLVDEIQQYPDDIRAQVDAILEPMRPGRTKALEDQIESLQDDIHGNEEVIKERDDEINDLADEVKTLREHVRKWEDAYNALPLLDAMSTLYHSTP